MGRETDIQWCDSTVNPTMGCDGCELWGDRARTCYAGRMTDGEGKRPGMAGRPGWPKSFAEVTAFPGRMANAAAYPDLRGQPRINKPWLDGLPRHIFVSDMSDALSRVVTFELLKTEIIDVANSADGRRHVWLWLTKRPTRMAEFSAWLLEDGIAWPRNLMPMASVSGQGSARARIEALLNVGDQSTRRGLSCEPILGPIDVRTYLTRRFLLGVDCLPGIDWLIAGGESGNSARPFNVGHGQELRDQCAAARVPFFMKQFGRLPYVVEGGNKRAIRLRDSHGGDAREWPAYLGLNVRQMPVIELPESIDPAPVATPTAAAPTSLFPLEVV